MTNTTKTAAVEMMVRNHGEDIRAMLERSTGPVYCDCSKCKMSKRQAVRA